MLFQGVDGVVSIGQTFIFDTKIIYRKGEGDGEIVMCPLSRSCLGLLVVIRCQLFGN
jgi:hypothetical protein